MKNIAYIASFLLCVGLVSASITLNASTVVKLYDNQTVGFHSGYAYSVPNLTGMYSGSNSSLYTGVQNSIGSCIERIDSRRSSKWNGSAFSNTTGAFKQIGNTTALAKEVYYQVQRGCTVIFLDWEMPSTLAVSNTTFCSAGSKTCYPADVDADARNRYDMMEIISPGGIYDSSIIYELGNEWNLKAFFGSNLERNNTNLKDRLFRMNDMVNATCLRNFSVSRPNLRCSYGAPTMDSWEVFAGSATANETSIIFSNIFGNFSNDSGYRLHGIFGHLYCGRYESDVITGTQNCYNLLNRTINDVKQVCSIKYNTTYCDLLPFYITEFGVAQADESNTDLNTYTAVQNLTFGNQTALAWYVQSLSFAYSFTNPMRILLFNAMEADCYELDNEYPNLWPYFRYTTSGSCTSASGSGKSAFLTKVNYTSLSFMQEYSPYILNGSKIHKFVENDPYYGWFWNNTNGSYYAVITNSKYNGTPTYSTTVVFDGINVVNATNVRNGSFYSVSNNAFTLDLGVNSTGFYSFGVNASALVSCSVVPGAFVCYGSGCFYESSSTCFIPVFGVPSSVCYGNGYCI